MLLSSAGIPLNKKTYPGNFKGWIARDDLITALLCGAFKIILNTS